MGLVCVCMNGWMYNNDNEGRGYELERDGAYVTGIRAGIKGKMDGNHVSAMYT